LEKRVERGRLQDYFDQPTAASLNALSNFSLHKVRLNSAQNYHLHQPHTSLVRVGFACSMALIFGLNILGLTDEQQKSWLLIVDNSSLISFFNYYLFSLFLPLQKNIINNLKKIKYSLKVET